MKKAVRNGRFFCFSPFKYLYPLIHPDLAKTAFEIFEKYVPASTVLYCHSLWQEYRIQFTVSRPRKTVYGNYIYKNGLHYITVNGDLSREAFLVTYLHEVAHLVVRVRHSRRTKPHGKEWQSSFRELMQPVLLEEVFQQEILSLLKTHLQAPKATSCADPVLHQLLMQNQEDQLQTGQQRLQTLSANSRFVFNGRTFRLIRRLRTRYECVEEKTGTLYRFQPTAQVAPIFQENSTQPPPAILHLHHIAQGSGFYYQQKLFTVVEKKRTRYLCKELPTGKMFLINQMAVVQPIEQPSSAYPK